ncbi:MAG: 50S ribosomal protein L6 [Candidatus Aminicenantes bacterium]|nr:50S ribosomal protein L6 [Candidatus Aminicenantes bacterium]
MSRKASKPIIVAGSINLESKDNVVKIKGPKGELSIKVLEGIEVKIEPGLVHVNRKDDSYKPIQGLIWSLLNNAVTGVSEGFSKTLMVVGKGWRSTVKGDNINLQVGYSHPVDVKLPQGVTATQKNPGQFTLYSHDKQLLGQVCANIQAIRPVEPYKLKGIRIEGQYLRQKVRKTAGV